MKGRKPIPTHLKIVRGNPGKRALPEDEPTPTKVKRGERMPSGMTPEAQKQWRLVARQLSDASVLTKMDVQALVLYCEAFSQWTSAMQSVRKFGSVIKSPSGFPVQSPYLGIANRAWDQMAKMLVEFGMTPSSRTRVAKAKEGQVEDEIDRALNF